MPAFRWYARVLIKILRWIHHRLETMTADLIEGESGDGDDALLPGAHPVKLAQTVVDMCFEWHFENEPA